jgi:hypothetical protein
MTPEENLATRVRLRYKLPFPIDVVLLARTFADLEEDNLPANVDAIVLHEGPSRARPLILLDPRRPPTRKLFTIAHEVGHLVIPWHVGTMACHVDRRLSFPDRLYASTEAEANRFASALLMPSDWVREVVKATPLAFDPIYDEFRKIGVSKIAATLRLVQFLPEGYVFAVCDEHGVVDFAGTSPESRVSPPSRGSVLDASSFDRDASIRWTGEASSKQSIFWWGFSEIATPPLIVENMDAKSLLKEIVSAVDPSIREKLYKQISSITGAARGSRKLGSSAELYNLFVQRFVGRTDVNVAVQNHPRLKEYLLVRAIELFATAPKK